MAYDKSKKQNIKDEIIEKMSQGNSLKSILDNGDHLPSRAIVYRWLNNAGPDYDKEFLNNYAQAREEYADSMFDDILNISDDNGQDTRMTENGPMVDHDVIQRSRLRVDSRKWILARMQPKKYGDRLDLTTDGEKLVTNIINLGSGVNPKESD